jgi:hypothetical protein
LLREPFVQHFVQVDVGQDWGDYSLNPKDNFTFERSLKYRQVR